MIKIDYRKFSSGLLAFAVVAGGFAITEKQARASDTLTVTAVYTTVDMIGHDTSVDATTLGAFTGGTAPGLTNSPFTQEIVLAGSAVEANVANSTLAPFYKLTTTANLEILIGQTAYGVPGAELTSSTQHCLTSARLMMASPGKYSLVVSYALTSPTAYATSTKYDGSKTTSPSTLPGLTTKSYTMIQTTGLLSQIACVLIAQQ